MAADRIIKVERGNRIIGNLVLLLLYFSFETRIRVGSCLCSNKIIQSGQAQTIVGEGLKRHAELALASWATVNFAAITVSRYW